MSVATGASTTVTKVLPAGVVTSYANVSLYVTFAGVTTRYNATIVNATANTAGSLTVTGVVFTGSGNHACVFNNESNADLDTNAVTLTPIGSIGVTAIPLDTTVTF